MSVEVAAEFRQVDQGSELEFLVRFLDKARQLDSIQAYKRILRDLLVVRSGDHLLEVGCGTGDDAIELASLVGAAGRVVGLDSSALMIGEAARRVERSGLPIELVQADAHRLDFPDASFDACRAERVLIYTADPEHVIAEMVRVLRPGGRIVIFDVDCDAASIDNSDRALTRSIVHLVSDRFPNGCIGRELPRLFCRAGLAEVRAVPHAIALTYEMLAKSYTGSLQAAVEAGLVSVDAVGRWWQELEEAVAEGHFCCTLYGYVVAGIKPGKTRSQPCDSQAS